MGHRRDQRAIQQIVNTYNELKQIREKMFLSLTYYLCLFCTFFLRKSVSTKYYIGSQKGEVLGQKITLKGQ
jgi:hypothetical protein